MQTYLYSYKDKGLEQRHCVVTTMQSNDLNIIFLVRINPCTWHFWLLILTEALKLLETKKWFLPVFPFMRLSVSHLKLIDEDCFKSLAINQYFYSHYLVYSHLHNLHNESLQGSKTCRIWKCLTANTLKDCCKTPNNISFHETLCVTDCIICHCLFV